MKFLKNFRLRRAKLTPDTSLENFRRRHASFVFSTYDCKNAVPAAGSWHFSSNDIYRFLQTGDMVSKRLYKHWILHLHVLQYLVETSLWQGLLNVERCIGAVQKWRHWGREGGKISRSRLLLFKTSRLSAPLASTLVTIKPLGDIPGRRFSQWGYSIPGHSQISLYYTFSIVPRWKNGRKIFPAKISKSTRSLGRDLLRMQTLLTSRWQSFWMAPPGWMIGAISRRNHWGIFPEVNCLKCVALTPPHAIYQREMITIDSLVCFSSMILRFLADPLPLQTNILFERPLRLQSAFISMYLHPSRNGTMVDVVYHQVYLIFWVSEVSINTWYRAIVEGVVSSRH